MRERKYVKFRTDMYEDTKSKIIDRMPKRDLIHYIWNRSVILAGKVNKEGDLYMSKNIPYTVETLAIEFNRDIEEIKIALDVLIELEMMELQEDKVYIVKNFVKHQNIKIKEKTETKEKIKIKERNEVKVKEKNINDSKNNDMENEIHVAESENEKYTGKNEESKETMNKFHVMPLLNSLEVKSDSIDKSDDKKEKEKASSSQHNNSPVILEMKKNQKASRKNIKTNMKNTKANKKKNKNEIIETYEDNLIENGDDFFKNEDNLIANIEDDKEDTYLWTDGGNFSLKDGEILLSEWAF